MESRIDMGPPILETQRTRCYDCYRPVSMCFCDVIPTIENRTHVLILQHMRERFHAFNTARIVKKALANSTLWVDHNHALAERLDAITLSENVGILHPGIGSRLLSSLPKSERPQQLVVIDGTWHHAKTLLRDIPRLNQLPRYRIQPTEPGRYRIRREPNATALSTLEATVAALRALEPETDGLGQLNQAFERMIDNQLDHPKVRDGWRVNQKRSQNTQGVPGALLGDLSDLVVAYGESEPGRVGCKRSPRGIDRRQTVYWVAQRLGTNETFRAFIQPRVTLGNDFCEHMGISVGAWEDAVTPMQFTDAWKQFARPNTTLVTHHASTMRLLANTVAQPASGIILKSVKYDTERIHATLEDFLASQQITPGPSCHPGRAGTRLANAIALIHYLRKLRGEFETSELVR